MQETFLVAVLCSFATTFVSGFSLEYEGNCPFNSHYDPCGAACPKTCKNMYTSLRYCTDICIPGCVCNEGYVKNDNGVCVSKHRCSEEVVCPPNKIYTQCGMNTRRTCENFYHKYIHNTFMCNPGCMCKEGFVETKNGDCVRPHECPKQEVTCDNNLVYQTCAGCQKTCGNRNNRIRCSRQCQVGCFCPYGLYYDEVTNKCAKTKAECYDSLQNRDCQARDPNSVFRFCGPCNPTCFDRQPACSRDCQPGCKCYDGYVEDPNGKCIDPSECPIY